jgi:hypothetical protein
MKIMSMVSEETLNQLKINIAMLVSKYDQLGNENVRLKGENDSLKLLVAEKEEENRKLLERYNTLKSANVFSGNTEDSLATKESINSIVREIDNCIALLNR